jgi:tRNA pseudouridine38-40 synthase
MTKSGRKKLVVELQYLGTAYDGWQPQPNQSSVYDVVAAALRKCTGETHGPVVAGRTDKGVHAKHQLVSVRTERSHDHDALVAALNAALPKDVRVLSAREAPATFHATTSVRQKTYAYYLALGHAARDDVAWRVEGLDLVKMRACAQRFVGENDYKVFSAGGKASGTTVRTIRHAVVEELEHVDLPFVGRVRGPLVRVGFEGDGFLKHQVRRMVGALVRVGRGDLAESVVADALRDPATPRPEVSSRAFRAPAHGLWLELVDFDGSALHY